MKRHRLIIAPLRGYTDVVFRNAFTRHLGGVEEAVAPFVTSIRGRRIKPSHLVDLAPADNRGLPLVPQILSNNSEEFICLANTLRDLGYTEVNWNLGCPYPMVAKKMRGSGLLCHPERVDALLERICSGFDGRLSIKTRLGRHAAAEMGTLVPIFNRYPIARIIVHPRTGVQMYDGRVDLDAFERYQAQIVHPVVYNGDINDLLTFRTIAHRFPAVSAWMLGRGLIANPFLAEMIQGILPPGDDLNRRFSDFHDALLAGYSQRFSGPAHVLDRMKGFWRYFATPFPDHLQALKKIRRAKTLAKYQAIVATLMDGDVPWRPPDGIIDADRDASQAIDWRNPADD